MLRLILVFVFLTMAPLTAQAQLNHPDLLDIDSWFTVPTSKAKVYGNYAHVYENESGNFANGFIHTHVTGVSGATIGWNLYEPDSIKRSHKRGRLSQGSWVSFRAATWDTGYGASNVTTTLEDCKAWTVTNGTGGVVIDAKWKASCKGVFAALGLPQDALDRIDDLFDNYVNVSKDKINITGKGPEGPEPE